MLLEKWAAAGYNLRRFAFGRRLSTVPRERHFRNKASTNTSGSESRSLATVAPRPANGPRRPHPLTSATRLRQAFLTLGRKE